MSTPKEKSCKVKSSCPKGYLRKTLVNIATNCDITIKRSHPLKNEKSMKEICTELQNKYGIDDTDCNNDIETTETFGMTVEYMICKIANIETNINVDRISIPLSNDKNLILVIQNLLTKIPSIVKHIGLENKATDFVLDGGKTLSVKTNQTGKKVCPQNIGQTTRDKFVKYFSERSMTRNMTNNISTTPQSIKSMIFENKGHVIGEYFKHTFVCDYLLWIVKSKDEYTGIIINRNDILNKIMDSRNYTFTRDLSTWNESSSIKYNNKTIGEFQVHNNRNSVKFRFNMDNLLTIFKNDPTVFTITNKNIFRNKTNSNPTRKNNDKNKKEVERLIKSRGGNI